MEFYVIKNSQEITPWVSVLDPFFPAHLPSLLSADDEGLKEAFWEKLRLLGPKLTILSPNPSISIEEEFQKKGAGVFAPLIHGLRQTVKAWHQELLSLRVLRLFEEPWSDTLIFEKIKVNNIKKCKAVIYTSCPPQDPPEMIGHMLGRHKKPLSTWYETFFFTMNEAFSYQKEWRCLYNLDIETDPLLLKEYA